MPAETFQLGDESIRPAFQVTDLTTEFPRDGVILQFTEGNPPRTTRLPFVVLGLWGGALEGTSIHISTDPATGYSELSVEGRQKR